MSPIEYNDDPLIAPSECFVHEKTLSEIALIVALTVPLIFISVSPESLTSRHRITGKISLQQKKNNLRYSH